MKHETRNGTYLEMFILFASILISFGSYGQNWRVPALNITLGLIVLWRQESSIRDFWKWWKADKERELAETFFKAEQAQNEAWLKSAIRDRKHIEMLTAVCRLASRAKQVAFDDPGDAVRWSKVIGDYDAHAAAFGCAQAPSKN